MLANLIHRRSSFQAAVEAPRLHTEGGEVLIDQRVGEKAIGIRVTDKGLEAGLDHLRPAVAAH